MEPTAAINAVEVTLRDLIEGVLAAELGPDWIDQCGTQEKVDKWRVRKVEGGKRRDGTAAEEGLLDYADFPDLATIIRKHWDLFKPALGDRKTFDVYMDRLEECRNPRMHSRLLVPFERSLVEGMAGEIRNKVTLYRSAGETADRYFPRIEYVRDSFGNEARHGKTVVDGPVLYPGDEVLFDCSGWDPENGALEWRMRPLSAQPAVQRKGQQVQFRWTVLEGDIGEVAFVQFQLVGARPHHRHLGYDGESAFGYPVFPRGIGAR